MEKAVFFIKVWMRSFSKMQKTNSEILWTAFAVKIAPGGRDGNATMGATSKAIRVVTW